MSDRPLCGHDPSKLGSRLGSQAVGQSEASCLPTGGGGLTAGGLTVSQVCGLLPSFVCPTEFSFSPLSTGTQTLGNQFVPSVCLLKTQQINQQVSSLIHSERCQSLPDKTTRSTGWRVPVGKAGGHQGTRVSASSISGCGNSGRPLSFQTQNCRENWNLRAASPPDTLPGALGLFLADSMVESSGERPSADRSPGPLSRM